MPRQKVWVKCFAEHAAKIAERAESQADNASTAQFLSWLHEGPATGPGRQHKLSRVATGWIPSRVGDEAEQDDAHIGWDHDDEVMNGLSAEQVAEAIPAQGANTTPLTAQQTVDLEAKEWGTQWAEEESYET